jgi:hypothetical protein
LIITEVQQLHSSGASGRVNLTTLQGGVYVAITSKYNKRTTVNLDEQTKGVIKAIADNYGISQSQVILLAVLKGLDWATDDFWKTNGRT